MPSSSRWGSSPSTTGLLPVGLTLTNIRGALITMPDKVTKMGLVDEIISPNAQIAGATNAVLLRDDGTLLAEQFDGAGSVRGALRKGFDPSGNARHCRQRTGTARLRQRGTRQARGPRLTLDANVCRSRGGEGPVAMANRPGHPA